MRRLVIGVLAGLVLLSGGIVWSFGGSVTAEDDDIAILQTQVAALDDRVTALESTPPDAAATPASGAILLDGRDPFVSKPITLTHQRYLARFTCLADVGWVGVYGPDPGEYIPKIPTGESVVEINPATYRLEVICYAAWSLSLTPF